MQAIAGAALFASCSQPKTPLLSEEEEATGAKATVLEASASSSHSGRSPADTPPISQALVSIRKLARQDRVAAAREAYRQLDTFLDKNAAANPSTLNTDEVKLSLADWHRSVDLFAEIVKNSSDVVAEFTEDVEGTVSQPFIEAFIAREIERDPAALWQMIGGSLTGDVQSSFLFHFRAHLIDRHGSREGALASLVEYAPEVSASAHWRDLIAMRDPKS